MTERQREVRSDSDALLDALEDMKEAEQRKRREQFSTPAFHELADEVDADAAHVWTVAAQEARDGDQVESTGASIESVGRATEVDPPG